MPTVAEQIAALEQQLAALRAQQVAPQGAPMPPAAPPMAAPPPQGLLAQPQTPAPTMRQVYGLLARYADDPTQVGHQYVQSALQREQIDLSRKQLTDPVANYLRMFGPIPQDGSVDFESIQRYMETPQFKAMFGGNAPPIGILKPGERKLLSKETEFLHGYRDEAIAADDAAAMALSLAQDYDRLAKSGALSGFAGDARAWLVKAIGEENATDLIQNRFTRFRNSEIVKQLPKGSASDRDIFIFSQGWMKATANPETVASFLRGYAKTQVALRARAAHAQVYLGSRGSEIGLLEDWMKNKDWMINSAMAQDGLTWDISDPNRPQTPARRPGQSPVAPTGEYTPEQKAEALRRNGLGR